MIILLVLQVLITGYVYRGSQKEMPTETTLFEGLQASGVRQVVISGEEQKRLLVQRTAEGWQVELADGVYYPADAEKVESLIEKLVDLKSARLVTRTSSGHSRLQVDENKFSRKLELIGEETRTLFLGTSPSYKSIHLRTGGSDNVYLSSDFAAWEVPPDSASWWDGRYVNLDAKRFMEISLTNPEGDLHLQRENPEGEWRVAASVSDATVDKAGIQTFLDNISQLIITDIIVNEEDKPQGEPLAVLTILGEAQQLDLQVWDRPDEAGDYTVKSSQSDFFARAGSYAVDDILSMSSESMYDDKNEDDAK